MVLLGQIAVARGQWHDAFELFDEVVRDYPSTRAAIPALLGRAEVYSVLGDDQSSLDDYQKLRETLSGSGPRRDVTADVVGSSLSDRHDAALTMAKLEPALSYILLTESLYSQSQLPEEFILRIASTSRQLAQNGIGDGSQLSPKQRYQANDHYKRAGDNYVRHARRLAGRPGADEFWADSLWLAADSYDLGGWHALAGTHFIEYVAGRSEADPRRPDAVFRLAQAYHAEMDYEAAAQHYDQVLIEHPRSAVASRSHVPLARCMLLLDRRPEAEQHLLQVVSGQQHLEPDAQDYRNALIELGTLYYDDEDYVGAIERLDEAVRRYPDDPRMTEIRFRLADGYRRHAATLEAELELPGRSPGERDRLEKKRTENLETAQQLFTTIIESDGAAQQVLRYAYLYRADCAFDLGRYAEAVEYYDQVASRFTRHHSSMTALIQIVNCYSNLGDDNRARTAHTRALVRLKKLPDEAFNQDDSLLDRDAWERWLQNMPAGDVGSASASS
jgi:tetratricopeptide (TPR) repeat protein